MEARDLDVWDVQAALRVIKALGGHRYVAGRKHLAHALVLGEGIPQDVDPASRDERLWRVVSEDEVVRVLSRFWLDETGEAREQLADDLERLDLPLPAAEPFSDDEDIHPIFLDCGWELLPLRELDPERHKGLIGFYDEPVLLESARFEEENAIPPIVHLQELSAIGPRELLFGVQAGELVQSLCVFCQGDPTYHDYILKGVLRAAKL